MPTALAQSAGTSTLQGTITDATGAVVPGAQVTVTNVGTGVARTEISNENGFYSAQSLQGGDYKLTITKAGFEKSNVQAIHLAPSTVLGVNPVLTVGDVTSEITVTADAVSVQTETSESGGTIPGKEVSQLMVNGRNFQTLATIVPGVTSVQGANQLTVGGASSSAQVQISVGGTSVEQTAYFIDGVYDSAGLNLFAQPTMDSIQEFRVLKGNYGANYGFVGSGQILVQTKSGGRQFHGTVFDYVRNNDLGTAKNFFYKQGTPYGLHQNIFGYSLGGPVFIPKIYNNDRAKTFFFASGEWHLTNSSQSLTRAFFPQTMRDGDFSASPTRTGNLAIDANSQALLASRGVDPATCIGANNQINKSCFDPVAVSLMNAYFPLPNAVVPGQFNNYVNTKAQRLFDSSVLYRLDHTINEKNQIMGRYMYEEANIQLAARNYNDPAPDPGASNYSQGLNAMARWTFTPTSNITNNAQISEVFLKAKNALSGNYTVPVGTYIPLPLGQDPLNRIPSMQINGGWNWLGVGAYPTYSNNGIGSISDDFSYLKGKHSLQFGGIYMIGITRANVATGNVPQGNFVFSGVHTGDPAADYLLGLDASFVQINQQRAGVFHYRWFEGYAQDDYHVTPRFVANLGLRWTYYGPTTREGNQVANFSASTFDPAQAPVVNPNGSLVTNASGVPATSTGANANLTNGLVIAGQNGVPAGIINPRKSYFAPRVGFAYRVTADGKTSVHGGYGIAYTQVNQQNTIILLPNPPYTKNINITNSLLSNPSAGTPAAASVQSLQAVGYDFRAGLIQTFSLTLEREIVPHGVLSLAYAGNTQQHTLSTQLDANFPTNSLSPQTTSCLTSQSALKNNTTPAPSSTFQFDPCLNTGTNARAYYRPYKGYDQILSTMSGGSGNYHSFQSGFIYRTSSITLNAAYTFAKSLSDVVPSNPGSNGGSGVGYNSAATFQNSNDIASEYGRPDYARTHVFTSAIVYQLPFFKNSTNFLEHEFLSGWGLSGLAIIESGFALTPSNTNGDAGLSTRPDQVLAPKYHGSGKVGLGEPNYFVNPTGTYRKPAYGFFGNARNGSIVGPKEVSFDVSATKAFPIYKSFNAELRVEAFNVFNHPNITSISTQYGAANFGQAIAAGDPRIMEAAFRLSF
ncbi:carboxypeptidase-like regulatory domain-containing protein [Granulicella sp. WH15]|uniref:TonB-dependent receptor n=1 Tax=Granulicella sp. WH15 TaxID=2602070 RepID=UPI002107ECA9|nr:carboxypeptidase-like regulatory domain-containing protein [Granulicella sp. WH15]